jgi:DNA-binding NtrC family response regulator
VLISGETGTGKELIARAIHYLGPRSGQPFITVDCGALPEHLVENELFGHARGAYTDAGAPFKGLVQEADGGTLFLDEVEALPLAVQSKLLRFLQERQYKPLGQVKYLAVDVRVVAATNLDLAKAVEKKTFREDLYYRLNVIRLRIPPLSKRKADIPALVQHFMQQYAPGTEPSPTLSEETKREWLAYHWPGNVRELENRVQEWLSVARDDFGYDPTSFSETAPKTIRTLAAVRHEALEHCERAYLQNLLSHTKGNLSAAARLAGIHRKSLSELLKRYGMDARRFRQLPAFS